MFFFFLILELAQCAESYGLISGDHTVPGSALSASSSQASGLGPRNSRITSYAAWVPPNPAAGQWLQVKYTFFYRLKILQTGLKISNLEISLSHPHKYEINKRIEMLIIYAIKSPYPLINM